MADSLERAVRAVVRNDNCTGCGGCTVVSRRISMRLSDEGWMRPEVDAGDHSGSPRADARAFRSMCPGVRLDSPTIRDDKVHPTFGRYISAWKGEAVDADVREAGSSAGVLTALSAYLVDSGRAQAVRGAAMDPTSPTRTVPVRITSRDEALAAAGSRYAPVSTLADIDGSADAVVAKPCEISALRRLGSDGRDQPFSLSFFCAGTPSQHATNRLISKLDIDPERVTALRYRGNGWPGDFTAADGSSTATMSYDDSWGKHLGRDLQWRCKICPDGTGEDADVAVGDFWHADAQGYPLFDNAAGVSVVIARTSRGQELLEAASAAGVVALTAVDLDEVERIQPLQRARKKTVGIRLAARLLTFKRVPAYRGYGVLRAAWHDPRLSARTFLGTLARSWRDRLHGRRT